MRSEDSRRDKIDERQVQRSVEGEAKEIVGNDSPGGRVNVVIAKVPTAAVVLQISQVGVAQARTVAEEGGLAIGADPCGAWKLDWFCSLALYRGICDLNVSTTGDAITEAVDDQSFSVGAQVNREKIVSIGVSRECAEGAGERDSINGSIEL